MKFLFIKSIFVLLFNIKHINSFEWTPKSWMHKKVYQNIEYPDQEKLEKTLNELGKNAPLIFAGESLSLKEELIKASKGEAFVLIGGDCAETFREFKVENIMNTYRILLQMTLIFMYGMSKPVVKMGRMAGQFAKPRSEIYETINNITLPSYRGDIVNLELFDEESRIPNPNLMLKAYGQSAQTMNLIRALSEGGYADIERINDWNLDFVKSSAIGKNYEILANSVNKALNFVKAMGINTIYESKKAKFYIAHEALLLPYETALTREDSITKKYFGCSAHMLWIGERTRQLDGAHVEYMRGIENPIGIKISEKCNANELEELLRLLNPDNNYGKIILMTRMGKNIESGLPKIVDMIRRRNLNVVWVCDPMHGNTVKLKNGLKTRYLEDIMEEYKFFNDYLKKCGLHPGGIHLEMTGRNVKECIDKNTTDNEIENMVTEYESSCDPRLSADQCLYLAFYIISL